MTAELFILSASYGQVVGKNDLTDQRDARQPQAVCVYPCWQLQTGYIRLQIALDPSETRRCWRQTQLAKR
jgi:hypothetical protein